MEFRTEFADYKDELAFLRAYLTEQGYLYYVLDGAGYYWTYDVYLLMYTNSHWNSQVFSQKGYSQSFYNSCFPTSL